VDDCGDLGAHWPATLADDSGGGNTPILLTFMNNIGTAEGPDALTQYAFDRASYTMCIERREGGRLVAHDTVHGGRLVDVCCAHFSGSAKLKLTNEWLRRCFGVDVDR
jgi:hypothetical protein